MAEIDYDAVLADLEAKRQAIDDAIASIRRVRGIAIVGMNDTGAGVLSDLELRSDSFFGLTIAQAIEKYLKIVKRPRTVSEIVEALPKGGLISGSKHLYSTVLTTMRRENAKKGGNILRVNDQWGLAEWYSGNVIREQRAKKATPGVGENADEGSTIQYHDMMEGLKPKT